MLKVAHGTTPLTLALVVRRARALEPLSELSKLAVAPTERLTLFMLHASRELDPRCDQITDAPELNVNVPRAGEEAFVLDALLMLNVPPFIVNAFDIRET